MKTIPNQKIVLYRDLETQEDVVYEGRHTIERVSWDIPGVMRSGMVVIQNHYFFVTQTTTVGKEWIG